MGDAARVLVARGHDPSGVDIVAQRYGLSAEAVGVAWVERELAGAVASLQGGMDQRPR